MTIDIARVLTAVIYVIGAPLLGILLDGIDRKITARMQRRQGPPLLQPLYDLRKLFGKQPTGVNRAQFFLTGSYMLFIIFSGVLFFSGSDILLCTFALTTADMFLVLAANCASAPYSFMGANRELIQMVTCEPMLILTCVGFYLTTGSFQITDIALSNGLPSIALVPGFFIGFIFILTIKLRKSPFDESTSHHAHQEIVKGITTEMSGPTLALINLAEWYEKIILCGMIALFFLNGSIISVIVAIIAIIIAYFLEILIDNSSARVKWEVMFKVSWAVVLCTAGLNLFILNIIR